MQEINSQAVHVSDDEWQYRIAVGQLPNVGSILAKRLIAYCGSAMAVFKEGKKALGHVPGIGTFVADSIIKGQSEALRKAENELVFTQKHRINKYFFLDEEFPSRLKNCEDGPVVLFTHGEPAFNKEKIINLVGTRNATEYGKSFCAKLIEDLHFAGHDFLVVSGLAYGIDIAAHKAALETSVPTLAVLAHGLSTIYPAVHRQVAAQITEHGGLVTEFLHDEPPDRQNFVKRNRIIAGLSDATIVVESADRGGALITADLASSYNRDVFALPGRAGDKYSQGCNWLLKKHKASIIESAEDLEYLMGWDMKTKNQPAQRQLFIDLTKEEQIIADAFKEEKKMPIDAICSTIMMPMSQVSALLLGMEFKGAIKSLPGKVYELLV